MCSISSTPPIISNPRDFLGVFFAKEQIRCHKHVGLPVSASWAGARAPAGRGGGGGGYARLALDARALDRLGVAVLLAHLDLSQRRPGGCGVGSVPEALGSGGGARRMAGGLEVFG